MSKNCDDRDRCNDCGDPASQWAEEVFRSPVWGVTNLPPVPVCSPCALRRSKKRIMTQQITTGDDMYPED